MSEIKLTLSEASQDLQDGIIQIKGHKYYTIAGNSFNPYNTILNNLLHLRPGLKEVHNVEDCDVILAFCPIVSRAGTDIEAAVNDLKTIPESKPVIFMVLHHTFDTDKVVPESSRFIKRTNTLTVDCLFHEDVGLLKCKRNDKALDQIAKCFKIQDYPTYPTWRFGVGILLLFAVFWMLIWMKDNPSYLLYGVGILLLFVVIWIFNWNKNNEWLKTSKRI